MLCIFQLGSKFGTWLLERQLTPKYGYIGANKEGCGGLTEQIPHQSLDPQCAYLPALSGFVFADLFNSSNHPQDQAAVQLRVPCCVMCMWDV